MKEVIGDLRRSQLASSFGVGSMVDLPSLTGVVMGLDYWEVAKCPPISEPRLLRAVQRALANPRIAEIRQGPPLPEQRNSPFPTDPNGVPVALFPRWLRCPLCSILAPTSSGLYKLQTEPYQTDKTRYIHEGCLKRGSRPESKMPGAVPARFVVACENGHLEDFPWIDFVHHGSACTVPKPNLRLYESGVSGEASDVFVRCEDCRKTRPMSEAFGRDNDISKRPCRGYHVHLHASKEGCTGTVKTMLIGASNSHFPLLLSVLSLPATTNPIEPALQRHWATLSAVTDKNQLAFLRQINQLGDLEIYTDDQIWEGIQRLRSAAGTTETDTSVDIKRPEWTLLSGSQVPILTERLKTSPAPSVPPSFRREFSRVVLVEKLTEVRAMIGFTRIESAGDMSELDALPPERRVPLSRKRMTWVPGVQVCGEGIFIQFNEVELSQWESSDSVKQRIKILVTGHEHWRNARSWLQTNNALSPPTARYVLLHTFAHLLMREMGIRCGYGTASLRERIYCASVSDSEGPMAGVFIGTSSSDSEGTLGGLVALGKSGILDEIIRAALARASVCSSDPICASHDPSRAQKLHAAACHSCGFVPETSCERSNSFLDRTLVVETLDKRGASFFGRQR